MHKVRACMLGDETSLCCNADLLQAPFWQQQVHDCQTGAVTAVATSFDESFLLTAAQDGTLYIHVSPRVTIIGPCVDLGCHQLW